MIRDTCRCGAEIEISYRVSSLFESDQAKEKHSKWLDAHAICRANVTSKPAGFARIPGFTY